MVSREAPSSLSSPSACGRAPGPEQEGVAVRGSGQWLTPVYLPGVPPNLGTLVSPSSWHTRWAQRVGGKRRLDGTSAGWSMAEQCHQGVCFLFHAVIPL